MENRAVFRPAIESPQSLPPPISPSRFSNDKVIPTPSNVGAPPGGSILPGRTAVPVRKRSQKAFAQPQAQDQAASDSQRRYYGDSQIGARRLPHVPRLMQQRPSSEGKLRPVLPIRPEQYHAN